MNWYYEFLSAIIM